MYHRQIYTTDRRAYRLTSLEVIARPPATSIFLGIVDVEALQANEPNAFANAIMNRETTRALIAALQAALAAVEGATDGE